MQPASPSAIQGESDSRLPTRWYGAPIVAADVATVALLYATSAYSDSYQREHGSGWSGAGAAYGLLGAAYVFNGAMVHALNHQPRHAGQSALLRLGGAVAGVATSASIILGGKCFESTADSALAGVTPSGTPVYCAVGVAALFAFPLAALAIDDAFLARAPIDEAPSQLTHATVAPSLVVKPGLALLGLGASF